jgi:polynucleotide 5'-kinase involved in rRNA processing
VSITPPENVIDLSAPGWESAIRAIADDPGVVMVLGAPDLGKSTWLGAAAEHLARAGRLPLAIVDADIGQASIGPPATVALTMLRELPIEPFSLHNVLCDAFAFVGSISPTGHLLQLTASTAGLVAGGKRRGAATILVDTTGLVTPVIGFQLKLRKVELLNPAHIVALQRKTELEPLLSVIGGREGLCIHRLGPSTLARSRTPTERMAYRTRRFAAYFSESRSLALTASNVLILNSPSKRYRLGLEDLSDILPPETLQNSEVRGLLVGLNNAANETVGVGVLQGVNDNAQKIFIKTPVKDTSAIRILQLGSLHLPGVLKQG